VRANRFEDLAHAGQHEAVPARETVNGLAGRSDCAARAPRRAGVLSMGPRSRQTYAELGASHSAADRPQQVQQLNGAPAPGQGSRSGGFSTLLAIAAQGRY